MTWPCFQCHGPLGSSPSDDFCSDSCQTAWHSKHADHTMSRPRPTAVPHPLGGITYPVDPSQVGKWWEDHDPDPVPGGGDRFPTRASGA